MEALMTERRTPHERYAEAIQERDKAQRDAAYWESVLRLLEENYRELRPGAAAETGEFVLARQGRYREIFEGDRRLAIADAILRRGGRARDIDMVPELQREDLVIPTRERDPEKHYVAYLKRVRQSLSGNTLESKGRWFVHVAEGRTDQGEEWHEYEVTELARERVAAHFGT